MSDTLTRIKRAVLAGCYAFSEKARVEMEADGITESDVVESILNAVAIYKTVRSRGSVRSAPNRRLHIIQSSNFEGLAIYTKGALIMDRGVETYYFLISAKRAL